MNQFQIITKDTVTIRNRDTTEQNRVEISKLCNELV